jgi:hypothetical protein
MVMDQTAKDQPTRSLELAIPTCRSRIGFSMGNVRPWTLYIRFDVPHRSSAPQNQIGSQDQVCENNKDQASDWT